MAGYDNEGWIRKGLDGLKLKLNFNIVNIIILFRYRYLSDSTKKQKWNNEEIFFFSLGNKVHTR